MTLALLITIGIFIIGLGNFYFMLIKSEKESFNLIKNSIDEIFSRLESPTPFYHKKGRESGKDYTHYHCIFSYIETNIKEYNKKNNEQYLEHIVRTFQPKDKRKDAFEDIVSFINLFIEDIYKEINSINNKRLFCEKRKKELKKYIKDKLKMSCMRSLIMDYKILEKLNKHIEGIKNSTEYKMKNKKKSYKDKEKIEYNIDSCRKIKKELESLVEV
jgi:hypothetical protein